MTRSLRNYLWAALFGMSGPYCPILADEPQSMWKQHTINHLSPFEAVGVADFNQDGKLDVFSGDSWYAAPNWEAYKVRDVPRGTNPHYYEDFADAPLDVNRDGQIDIVIVAPGKSGLDWFENLRLSNPNATK